MKKFIVSAAFALSLLSAGTALAQSACVSVSPTLTAGSRGAQVSTLQSFLVSRNYPGGGNWMVTGYFGTATQAAVRNFQQEQNLPQTGVVDSATAGAISSVSCGYLGATQNYQGTNAYNYGNSWNPYNYNSNYNDNNNYSGYTNYPYGNAPTIASLSQNTGFPGNSVTIYGSGFDPVSNTVNFGTQALYGISSQNGTALTFTIPSYYASYSFTGTSIQLTVTNSRGTSNSVGFTNYGGSSGCGYYPYNTYPYNAQCNYNNYPPSNPSNISLQYLSPQSGAVGTSVTVFGSGFSTNGNTLHFGSGIITNLNSPDGRSVSFIIPTQLTGFGSQPVTIGTYGVSVTNSYGISSNTLQFDVTSTGSSNAAPVISSVTGPTSLQSGVQGTWSLTMNNPSNSYATVSVNWGDSGNGYVNMAAPQMVYANGTQTLTFTHTYFTAGMYTITFTANNQSGLSNIYSATISVGGSGTVGNPTISYLSPQSGRVGTQVTIAGNGFSAYGNTVHFGSGGTQNLPSYNGTTIYYTIPTTISPCDVLQTYTACPQYIQQVTPGQYQLYVTSGNGTSNTLTFNVTY